MPKFGKKSLKNLKQLHPDLQVVLKIAIKYYDFSIICGTRGKTAQNKAFKDGFSGLMYPKSKHNKKPSHAVDIAPYPIDWEDEENFAYLGGFIIGIAEICYNMGVIEHKIKWGGNWKNADRPHFEIYKPKKKGEIK